MSQKKIINYLYVAANHRTAKAPPNPANPNACRPFMQDFGLEEHQIQTLLAKDGVFDYEALGKAVVEELRAALGDQEVPEYVPPNEDDEPNEEQPKKA